MTGVVRFKGTNTRDTEVSGDNPLPVTGVGAGGGSASLTNPSPVLAEGRFNATPATITEGGYAPFQLTNRGALRVALYDTGITPASILTGSDTTPNASAGLATVGLNHLWSDGAANWVRERYDVAPIASAGVSASVLKASAGTFWSASMIAGATAGFFILYNAAAAPAGGAALTANLTLFCVPVAANGFASLGGNPKGARCSAGGVLLFSTSATTYTVPANVAVHMSGSMS